MRKDALIAALDAAKRAGAVEAEVIASRSVQFSVSVSEGAVENVSSAEGIGVGLRVFTADRHMGFTYTTELKPDLTALAGAAMDNASAGDPDPHNFLPGSDTVSEDDWCEESFSDRSSSEKLDLAFSLESKTLQGDPQIVKVFRARYGDSTYDVTLANSRGLFRHYRASTCSCSAVAAAGTEGGDMESGWEFDFARRFEDLRVDWVAEHCAKNTVAKVGGKPCNSGAMPVILDSNVTTDFLGVLGPALNARNVLSGKSLFAEECGNAIAADAVTLVDQNDLPEGIARAPFDGEGVSAERTVIVDGGVLRGFLQNTYTADRMGVATTANASRAGYGSVPEVGATNFFLAPGTRSLEQLISEVENGLYVTDAMGVHTADPISGDFSFGITGILVENGKLSRPVRGVTLAGNIKQLLKDIAAVGEDLRFYGAYGAPSVLVTQLMVSGT